MRFDIGSGNPRMNSKHPEPSWEDWNSMWYWRGSIWWLRQASLPQSSDWASPTSHATDLTRYKFWTPFAYIAERRLSHCPARTAFRGYNDSNLTEVGNWVCRHPPKRAWPYFDIAKPDLGHVWLGRCLNLQGGTSRQTQLFQSQTSVGKLYELTQLLVWNPDIQGRRRRQFRDETEWKKRN